MPSIGTAKGSNNRNANGCCSAGATRIVGSRIDDGLPAPDNFSQIELSVGGMTCGGCVARIESALSSVSGVGSVSVDVDAGSVAIGYDPGTVEPERLRSVILSAGYQLNETREPPGSLRRQRFRAKPLHWGLAVALGAVAFYLGLITLTSDWYNAKMQFSDYRWWIAALAVGLGVQVALYAALRRRMRGSGLKAANRSVAASGGMSTAAMAVCCSHYLAVFLPLIGLPFLSAAAAGLERYQVEFFAAGVAFNIVGIVLMARQLKRNDIPLKAALG